MLMRLLFIGTVSLLGGLAVWADDWPTYDHDVRRSGVSEESVEAAAIKDAPPRQIWEYQSPQPPSPAWPGPAKWDSFKRIIGLKSMRSYDPVFHLTISGSAVYFGSSSDDAVHCLDAANGKERWVYTVDGPVRIPPMISDGRLYFGCDDGNAYCIDTDAKPVWHHFAGDNDRSIPSDGKLISMWPVRTGVTVEGGKAYFGAGLVPWEKAFLCAVDAETGNPDGTGLYKKVLDAVTIEGSIVVSPTRLYVPQGRVEPMVFDRATGESLGTLSEGGGGVFVLLTPDMHILHGPGNQNGWVTESDAETRDKVAAYSGANCMRVTAERAYVLKSTELSAVDRKSGQSLWTVPCEYPNAMIVVGKTLFLGGTDAVAGFSAETGECVWSTPVRGRAYGLAFANGVLYVSTDEGTICGFAAGSALPKADSEEKK